LATLETAARPLPTRLAHYARIVGVTAHAEFKLKYSGSALGYVWSVVKPLGLFGMLYIVFGRFFKLNAFAHYPIYLLVGIVLWTYFADATNLSLYSLVNRGSLLSKLAFPRAVIPLSVTTTTAITLGVNLIAIAVFIAASGIVPTIGWLALIPLLLELFVVTAGVSLFLSALFVRLRDLSQVWELCLQLMFYASPIIYPPSYLPPWWRPIAYLSPFNQVIQDARAVVLPRSGIVTPTDVYHGPAGQLIPLAIGAAIVIGGYAFFRRQSPWFAERV